VEDRLLPLKQTVRHPLDPRDTVRRMETFEAVRECVLDRALGPIEVKGVADPVPLFRAASS
jgi:class 3 adenylate cyclase